MKKWIVMLAMLSLLTACAQTPEPAELTKLSAATSESADAEETAVSQQTSAPTAAPIATPEPTATPSAAPKLTVTPAPTPAPTPEPTAAPTAEPAPAQVSMSYGAVPFDLAAGTEQWWSIDSSDSAYWAVQENINALRAAGGLGPLTMDSGLSAAADARCESFVAGGPFDHSGMTTRSEICAAGPLGSASAVCTGWQGSPAHYANINLPERNRQRCRQYRASCRASIHLQAAPPHAPSDRQVRFHRKRRSAAPAPQIPPHDAPAGIPKDKGGESSRRRWYRKHRIHIGVWVGRCWYPQGRCPCCLAAHSGA